MNRYRFTLPILAVFMMGAAPAFEDTSLLDRQVAGHLGARIGDGGGALAPIDPKLKLKLCPGAVEISETHRNAVLVIPVRADRKAKELMARVSGAGEVELTQ